MFLRFYLLLKRAGLPVSFREYLALLEGLQAGLAGYRIEDFYALARTALIKHERHFDRFDQLFAHYFKGIELIPDAAFLELPAEWLRQELFKELTEEEKAAIEALGGLDKLRERLEELLKEQHERHEGGNKWIGTGGTSPFGNGGYNPEGIRIGGKSTQKRALKVWEERRFQNLNDKVEIGTRSFKLALKHLRQLTREGVADELDIDGTIRRTARQGGILDLEMVPSRQNRVKVLLLLDVGGSMTPYAKLCSELFSAARYEFKHLETFYFHNFIYESVWKDNDRRHSQRMSTTELLNTYNHDYKVIWVGDAAMGPYEVVMPGGSVEHNNAEAGSTWFQRFSQHFPAMAWLNPEPQQYWYQTQSLTLIQKLIDQRMYPLTLEGLSRAIKVLKKPNSRPAAA
jgi:uncharacterized protein